MEGISPPPSARGRRPPRPVSKNQVDAARESPALAPIDLNIESRLSGSQSAATSSSRDSEDNGAKIQQQEAVANSKEKKRERSTSGDGAEGVLAEASDRPQKKVKSTTDVGVNLVGVFQKMPLDILGEVFKLLTPMDLLTLSRVNKTFMAHLLDEESKSLWKSAFSSRYRPLDPPFPCPEGMTFIRYAKLLYGRQIIDDDSYTLKSDHQKLIEKLSALKEEPEREEYIKKQSAKVSEMGSRSERCKEWRKEFVEAMKDKKEKRRRERKEMIYAKLKDSGYASQLKTITNHFPTPAIRGLDSIETLTEQEWLEIRPEVIASVKTEARRLDFISRHNLIVGRSEDLYPIVEETVKSHGMKKIFGSHELVTLDPFKSIIYGTPARIDVKKLAGSFPEGLLGSFSSALKSWKDDIDSRLLGLVSRGLGLDSESKLDTTALSRATTIFACSVAGCKKLLTYPKVISHKCFVKTRSHSAPEEPCGDSNCEECTQGMSCPLNQHCDLVISFHKKGSTWAKTIVTLIDADPEVLTCAEMDASGCLLECKTCSQAGMTWDAAMQHWLKYVVLGLLPPAAQPHTYLSFNIIAAQFSPL
ncbi:hypothetical protein MD484_g5510, partial [Candolleomyces efflorescens]